MARVTEVRNGLNGADFYATDADFFGDEPEMVRRGPQRSTVPVVRHEHVWVRPRTPTLSEIKAFDLILQLLARALKFGVLLGLIIAAIADAYLRSHGW